MKIRELRFNIQFEYIKEIRKYLYDVEEFLKENFFCDSINPVPPVPDDFEPQIERLSTIKTEDDKTINIFISQTYISILFIYTKSFSIDECFDKDLDSISIISKGIKDLFLKKYSLFKVNFEGLILAFSNTIIKDDDTIIEGELLLEEERKKTISELDSKHFKCIEKSTVRFYEDEQNINEMAIRNSKDKFVGWNYIFVLEINNRLEYYNSKVEDLQKLEINLDFVRKEINKIIKNEVV